MASYDPNTDYSDLIAAEAAKGVNANRQLLAQLEASRNAKIAAERLPYAQTAVYTSELGRPLGYYEATDRSDYINEIYDTAREQALSALESAYESALGGYDAAKAAVEAVDTCVGRVAAAVDEMGGVLLITADHGNADKMVDADGEPFTAHTTNPVPFCVVGYPCTLREGGVLADIAPTMLKIMGLPQPEEMTGKSIIL